MWGMGRRKLRTTDAYEFRDAMRAQARFAAVGEKTPKAIRDELHRKAQELELPIKPQQIQISKRPEGTTIVTKFKVPVDLPLFLQEVESNFRERGQ